MLIELVQAPPRWCTPLPRCKARSEFSQVQAAAACACWITRNPLRCWTGRLARKAKELFVVQPTDISEPNYFLGGGLPVRLPSPRLCRVHRLIAPGPLQRRLHGQLGVNVLGVLGRTCDRPCEPACRRGRVEQGNASSASPRAGAALSGARPARARGDLPPQARGG